MLQDIKTAVAGTLPLNSTGTSVHYAEVPCSSMNPSEDKTGKQHLQSHAGVDSNDKLFSNGDTKMVPKSDQCTKMEPGTRYNLGGLTWNLPVGQKMEDCLLFWIGSDDSAFANVVLTFNNCEVGKLKIFYSLVPCKVDCHKVSLPKKLKLMGYGASSVYQENIT